MEFRYKGKIINGSASPQSLKMKEFDVIKVHNKQLVLNPQTVINEYTIPRKRPRLSNRTLTPQTAKATKSMPDTSLKNLEQLTIKTDTMGDILKFKIDRSTQMYKVMNSYCNIMVSSLIF